MSFEAGKWFEAEIREQPETLRSRADQYYQTALDAFQGKNYDLVLLAARGSSDHAALYLRYLIEIHLKIPAVLAAPSVLTRYGSKVRYPNTLAIGISQSGAAPDVAEILEYMREEGHDTLAITNAPGSRLAKSASSAILLDAGLEKSVAASKTYSASLLVGYQLTRALGADLSAPELPNDEWVHRCMNAAMSSLPTLLRASVLFALGRGYEFSTASEAALKLMECALLPCKSYSTADFEHGPKALLGPGTVTIRFDESASEAPGVILCPSRRETPCSPIWSIVFAQWLALYAGRARGMDPDRPRHLTKVTETF